MPPMPRTDSIRYRSTSVPSRGSSIGSDTRALRAVSEGGQLASTQVRPTIMDRSLVKKGVAAALTLLALTAPQAFAAPPINDNYLSSLRLNDPGSRLDRTNTLVDNRAAAEATTQADVFAPPRSGGPAEQTTC